MGDHFLFITIVNAAEKAVYWFNEPGFIKVLEKIWVLLFPASYLHPRVRKHSRQLILLLYNKLPLVKRQTFLENQFFNIDSKLDLIGQSQRKATFRQKRIEDYLNIATLDFDEKLKITDASEELLFLIGKEKSDVLGNGFLNSVRYGDRERFKKELSIAQNEERENDFEIELVHEDSYPVPVKVKLRPIPCLKGNIIGVMATLIKKK